MTNAIERPHFSGRRNHAEGFSLIELMVAMAVFLIISITAFTLFSRHQSLLSQEQGMAGLNIGLRNAISQIQIDAVNAANGLILGANVPAWPVGITIVNSNPTTAQCNPSATNPATYAAACFDQLNVVMVDANTPPVHPQTSAGGCINTNTGTTLYGGLSGVINPATGSAFTAAQVYPNFKTGDQLLFVTATGSAFTTAKLTANGAASSSPSGYVGLTFTSTGVGGTNTTANDPISMTIASTVNTTNTTVSWVSGNKFVTGDVWDGQTVQINGANYAVSTVSSATSLTLATSAGSQSSVPFFPSGSLTSSFCSTDWVLRLLPIQYSVSVANASDPQLVRTQGGVPNVVMDQVIGFKVGAAWWDNDPATYAYDYLTSDYGGDFTRVRAVRVTLIGRTAPSTDPFYTYRNPFDSGAYQIRGSSVVVDPRNLTMGND